MPRMRPSGNRVVDDPRFPRGDTMTEKLLLDEPRIGCVQIDAMVDEVTPEIPVETSCFGRVAEAKYDANPKAPQKPECRSRTHDGVEFRREDVRRPEPPGIGQQVKTGTKDVPGG